MNYITSLLTLQNQLRIFHWQTTSHSAHKALGKTYENLDNLIDTFVEEFMGSKGIIRSENGFKIVLSNIDECDINDYINKNIQFLTTELPKSYDESETNLSNVRDDMLGELQKLKYLLTQK
jgi:Family of unknown function (DUF5856)